MNRKHPLKQLRKYLVDDLIAGVLLLLPTYLTILLLLKAMKSLGRLVRPLARLLPESFPAEQVISFLAVLVLCILVGMVLRTSSGTKAQARIEDSVLQKIPGYGIVRGMTRQLTGQSQDSTWQPALVEIEDALVPAFIVEELEGRRFTVFVPSVPTPLAGAVYILGAERVHPLNVPFTQAVKAITRWGLGSKDLVSAMKTETTLLTR